MVDGSTFYLSEQGMGATAPRRILIIGTSNSILTNGWTYGFQDALKDVAIDNLSVGASPGVQFAEILERDLSKYDLAIFDSLPNDEEFEANNYWSRGYSKPEFTDELLHQIISSVACHCPVFVLAISRMAHLMVPSSVYLRRRVLAASLGCQFIDFRDILAASVSLSGDSPDSLYEAHPSHPRRELVKKLGYLLGDDIRQNGIPAQTTENIDFTSYFTVRRQFSDAGFLTRKYKNSRVEETATVLFAGQSIQVTDGGILVGIVINLKDTNCALLVRGVGQIKIPLYFEQTLEEGKIQKFFVPVANGFETHSIEIMSPNKTLEQQDFGTLPRISLISLIFWSGKGVKRKADLPPTAAPITISHRLKNRYLRSGSGSDMTVLKKLILSSFQEDLGAVVLTFRRMVLCFDRVSGDACHLDLRTPVDRERYIPLSAKIVGKKMQFWVVIPGIELLLGVEKITNKLTSQISDQFPPAEFNIEFNNGALNFLLDGKYLCAERDGSLVSNRKTAGLWESFNFGPRSLIIRK